MVFEGRIETLLRGIITDGEKKEERKDDRYKIALSSNMQFMYRLMTTLIYNLPKI
jgi:hypothetical protein